MHYCTSILSRHVCETIVEIESFVQQRLRLRCLHRIALLRVQDADSREIRVESSRPLLACPLFDVRRLPNAAQRQVLREIRPDILQGRLLSVSNNRVMAAL